MNSVPLIDRIDEARRVFSGIMGSHGSERQRHIHSASVLAGKTLSELLSESEHLQAQNPLMAETLSALYASPSIHRPQSPHWTRTAGLLVGPILVYNSWTSSTLIKLCGGLAGVACVYYGLRK